MVNIIKGVGPVSNLGIGKVCNGDFKRIKNSHDSETLETVKAYMYMYNVYIFTYLLWLKVVHKSIDE